MLSVIVPVYNEEENLPDLFDRLHSELAAIGRPYEIILVNDGSRDRSEELLKAEAARNPNVKLVLFRRNFGQTAAIMAGIDHATGDIIIPIDSDLQNDPADIKNLLQKLDEGYDVVSGWRRDRKDNAIKRNLPSRIANGLISWASGVYLHDYGCTLKAYRHEIIKGVRLYGEMHRFIPIYASWHGAKVTEIPVGHFPRTRGKSNYGLERVVKVLLDLIVVKFLASYAIKPIYIFGGFGIFSLFLSCITALLALWFKFVQNVSFILTPLPLMTALMFMTGVMSILMGLLAELIMRTYYESQSKAVYLVKETVNLGQDA